MSNAKQTKRSNKPLLFMTLLFIGPMILAGVVYKHPTLLGGTNTANGKILSPPIDVSSWQLANSNQQAINSKNLRGHWTLIYNSDTTCGQYCHKMIYNLRQIRTATGKEQMRVHRAVILNKSTLTPKLTSQIQTRFPGTDIFLKHNSTNTLRADNLYISDPTGQIMMQYSKGMDPMKTFKDMERLLKVSQIG